MADFQVTKTAVGTPIDTRWRVSDFGVGTEVSAQLDPTKFTSGTHYNLGGRADNVIPSGVAVAKLASGLYAPFDADAGTEGDPQRVLAGFIADVEGVALGASPSNAKPTFALAVVAQIDKSKLPIASQASDIENAEAVTGIFHYV